MKELTNDHILQLNNPDGCICQIGHPYNNLCCPIHGEEDMKVGNDDLTPLFEGDMYKQDKDQYIKELERLVGIQKQQIENLNKMLFGNIPGMQDKNNY